MSHTESLILNLWTQDETEGLDDLDLLVYQSRILGSDPRLVLWGGGNTSLKVSERDFRGRDTHVLRVKGSGSDLKAVTRRDFPGVRLDDVLPLMEREAMSDEEMVAYLGHALMEPNSPRPSIETLLHAFIPARSVVHSHADAILALTNNLRWQEALDKVYGDSLARIPYRRPGFLLSKEVGKAARARPDLQGVILLNHGLITWHDDPREAYRLHIELVDRAARHAKHGVRASTKPTHAAPRAVWHRRDKAAQLAPRLRGLLGRIERGVLQFHDSEEVMRFVTGQVVDPDRLEAVLEAGAATPDHILNTKRTPMFVHAVEEADIRQLADAATLAYERWSTQYREYFNTHTPPPATRSSQAHQQPTTTMLPPIPRVIVVEGLGIFTYGKDSRAANISADIYRHTIEIIEAAETVGSYRSLSPKDAFEAEYWPLELYKLSLAPPAKPLSRKVALVTGAAGAIGSAIARRFAAEGAHVVCADLDLVGVERLADELNEGNPPNRALGLSIDVTQEGRVIESFHQIALAYGGVDIAVSNAGFAHSAPLDKLELADWERSLAVNATGHFLVARESLRVMQAQSLGGSIVFIATKNVTAPGKEFGAYSAAKAAEAQLARVLAIEGGSHGIRSNIINPDAVFAGSGLWSPEVREERARAHGIHPDQIEEFYRARNLLNARVLAEDVAEAALFFASDRSAKTTGAMLPVDGGLREAFPR